KEAHVRSVAKIFHKPNPAKVAKLRAMLARPPDDPTREHHISIAWPTKLILNEQRKCIGFVMPYIERSKSFPLLKIYNPRDRQRMNLSYTWEYLLSMAHNLAYLLEELHLKGYVVGDLNESNILVTPEAAVTLIDCDSIQVPKELQWWERLIFWRRPCFRCTVGKPEYTAPELQGYSFSEVNRKPDHDNYALAVIIFLLLMEGRHPYAGVWKGQGEPPTQEQSMRARDFPYGASHMLTPAKRALPLDTLPPPVQKLMLQCFDRRPWFLFLRKRPAAHRWKQALESSEDMLVHCSINYSHVYSGHLETCPWCWRIQQGLPDPFPPGHGQQPTQVSPQRSMPRGLRRFFSTLARYCLIPLTLTFYAIEFYYWPRYNHWLTHVIWEVAGIFWLLLLLMPVAIYFALARRIKSF
ncbi:MAG TPA: hypothetical protein VKU38_15305, partial [Ktedonobacteraceae bacterium]|nr:hypothetical protein [Ktedonobacteraceae bacterium]